MGNSLSSSPSPEQSSQPEIPLRGDEAIITGIATEWPSRLIGPEELNKYALKFYPENPPWLQKLLMLNAKTGIETRAVIDLWDDPRWLGDQPPTAEEVDTAFREYGVELAKKAALKALRESNIDPSSITHMVSVTATNAGAPGYDQLVARDLGLPDTTERVLLSGVGCAGGCASFRLASALADAATHRKKEARILIVACELCSIQIRSELHAASQSPITRIGPVIFSDGAAALVVCNSLGMSDKTPKQFAIVDDKSVTTSGTQGDMSVKVSTYGFLATFSKKIPELAIGSMKAPLQCLLQTNGMSSASPTDFYWALHPGGRAIIEGVQAAFNLPEDSLSASYEIYKTRGNSSSVSILAVLEKVREKKLQTPNVVACSFGTGIRTEIALLRRLE
ncbi:chalcone synthase B [Aspergillus piperis CBS 112811]|uniref:Chalcone synthase B n=1 Tax=Aspergillus piperis CBS 112811 TaxID=1448313 RepID=A0A8G1VGA5_9EURO|nr:chalcone synthase B [Aspergillus piperis CBS 112811]RAH52041.1 chalcone synthase B [Aspergillus piperis CBS 112811]